MASTEAYVPTELSSMPDSIASVKRVGCLACNRVLFCLLERRFRRLPSNDIRAVHIEGEEDWPADRPVPTRVQETSRST